MHGVGFIGVWRICSQARVLVRREKHVTTPINAHLLLPLNHLMGVAKTRERTI
jgi:hypothetical protein